MPSLMPAYKRKITGAKTVTPKRAKKKVVPFFSGIMGVGNISKKAGKERVRRRKARKSTLKKAFRKIW
jgi:hypothetical protein